MNVLVSGGCGYIGSHQVSALLAEGHQVVIVDDLSNSSPLVIKRIEELTGTTPHLYVLDIARTSHIERILNEHDIEAAIHFAGHKHVRESVIEPAKYYRNNINGLLSLVQAAQKTAMRKLVFSSSGSVYGETNQVPIDETHPLNPSNPYSASKAICERTLQDLCESDDSWSIASLRYFNPAGAHTSRKLGDATPLKATNLLPVLMEVAAGKRSHIDVYGTDFDTPDGSGVRDYIHVEDVAETHLRAVEYLAFNRGHVAVNVGRGDGVSVFQMIAAVEEVTNTPITTNIFPSKDGDVSALFGETSKAQKLFGDMDYRSLFEIVESAWHWQLDNPNGYES